MECGFLVQMETGDGKKIKIPTEQGNMIGISSEERFGQAGPYRVSVYNTDAQQFILDNIDAIIEINARKASLRENKVIVDLHAVRGA